VNGSNLKEAFAAFFNPRTIFPFLLGAVFLGVLGNAVHAVLTIAFGAAWLPQLALAAVTLVGLVGSAVALTWLAARPAGYPALTNPRRPAKRRGLIFLFSKREPCDVAVDYHRPKLNRLWLVCSDWTNKDATVAAGELSAQHGIQVDVRQVDNVHDPLECYQRIQEIYANLPDGLTIDDVISDYTGMTAHASIGMTLACLHLGAALQYTPARFLGPGKPPIGSDPPFEVVLQGRRVVPAATSPT